MLPSSVVVHFDGKTFNINKDDSRYAGVLAAIKTNKLDTIPDLIDVEQAFNGIQGIKVKDGELFIDGVKMPDSITKRVLDFQKEGLPYENLIKFAKKLQLNPSFNSRQQLYKFLEHNGHPITTEGNFIAYRGVTNDFKDRHTGKFDNSVGSICEVKREEVDDNPNNTCSHGLHVACFDYANGFGPVTVAVEVDPRDVVAVPTDYNGTKMRVCKFKVVNVVSTTNNNSLVESSYDGETDISLDYSDDSDEATCYGCGDYEFNCYCPETDPEEEETEEEPIHFSPKSTVIKGVSWYPDNLTLFVEFHDGRIYKYSSVPKGEVELWQSATSVGKYFMKNIAYEYTYTQV